MRLAKRISLPRIVWAIALLKNEENTTLQKLEWSLTCQRRSDERIRLKAYGFTIINLRQKFAILIKTKKSIASP